MTKKLFSYLLLVAAIMLIVLPVSAEASGGTVISTVVPPKYTITFDIDGKGSVEYEDVFYKDGDTIQVREGTDMTFRLQPDKDYKLKSLSYTRTTITTNCHSASGAPSLRMRQIFKAAMMRITHGKTLQAVET